MKKKQLATIVLASAMMVSSLAACGNSSDGTTASSGGEATTAAPAATTEQEASSETPDTTAPEPEAKADPSVDFEDGKAAFAVVATNVGGADPSELAVVDFNGSKALKATNTAGGKMFIAINVGALLGDKAADLAEIRMDLGTENADKFAASSGTLYCYAGDDNHEFKAGNWSVYVESSNPKTAKFDVSGAGFVGKDNYIILSKETDNSKTTPSNLLIDNITFLDKNGATIAADSSAEFGTPAGFASASDSANLFGLLKPVNWDGYAVKGDGWAQAGVAMTDAIKEALVPGSVIEIKFKAETGHLWVVMNEAEVGWSRVGVGDWDGSGQQYAYINNAADTCQITYEQIAAVCGDDITKWGSMIQCESDSAWEVYGVRVGTAAGFVSTNTHIELGTGKKGDGWAQDGFDLTPEMIEALVPGSVIDISYKSETGEIWIVMPDSAAGWKRVGVGDYDGSGQGYALFDGNHCQISYEMIAEQCGEDKSTWGTRVQFEASSAWEVNGAWISFVK